MHYQHHIHGNHVWLKESCHFIGQCSVVCGMECEQNRIEHHANQVPSTNYSKTLSTESRLGTKLSFETRYSRSMSSPRSKFILLKLKRGILEPRKFLMLLWVFKLLMLEWTKLLYCASQQWWKCLRQSVCDEKKE